MITGRRMRINVNKIKNNRGMSLVELLIVMAVIGILAGTSFSMAGHIRHANIKKTVEAIDTELDKQRVLAMSKKDVPYLYIYRLDDGYYMRELTAKIWNFSVSDFTSDGVKICGNDAEIYMESTSGTKVEGTVFIRIAYKRNGVFDYKVESGNRRTNVTKIILRGNEEHVIELIAETGRHEVNP